PLCPRISTSVVCVPSSPAPLFVFLYAAAHLRALHSFPTRRSSDLSTVVWALHRGFDAECPAPSDLHRGLGAPPLFRREVPIEPRDRKSTRLNSSHVSISYAVFCLKKKKKIHHDSPQHHYDSQSQHC